MNVKYNVFVNWFDPVDQLCVKVTILCPSYSKFLPLFAVVFTADFCQEYHYRAKSVGAGMLRKFGFLADSKDAYVKPANF